MFRALVYEGDYGDECIVVAFIFHGADLGSGTLRKLCGDSSEAEI